MADNKGNVPASAPTVPPPYSPPQYSSDYPPSPPTAYSQYPPPPPTAYSQYPPPPAPSTQMNNFPPPPLQTKVAVVSTPVYVKRYTCVHCGKAMKVFTAGSSVVICPHCKRRSGLAGRGLRTRALTFLIIGLLFLAAATGITVGTYERAARQGGYYVAWTGGFIVGVLFLIRALLLWLVPMSPESLATAVA